MLLYRLLLSLILPVLVWRAGATWRARWRGPMVDGTRLWLHAASVGELNSIRPVLKAATDHPILVTCNTTTGLALVTGWNLPHVQAALAPFDRAAPTRKMMRNCRALIVVENELWPNRILAAHAANRPVVLLSARMSDRSARLWTRWPRLTQRLLEPVRLAIPQDATSATNLTALGVPPNAMTAPVPLKAAYHPTTTDPDPAFDPAQTVLAASTHTGEDQIILDAFHIARAHHPNLRLILAPRHPDRANDIATRLTIQNLSFTRQSKSESPSAPIHLADTLGQMDRWYASAGICLVGGSLIDAGGHTPFEPLAHNLPILHGPFTRNFADHYAALDAANGALCVRDAATLAAACLAHINTTDMPKRAKATLTLPDITSLWDQIKTALA